MKNFEKYMDELLSIHKSYIGSSIAIVDGKPKACDETPCLECKCDDEGNGEYALIEWLYEEADSDNKESEAKEVNNNTKRCKDCRHIYKRGNEEPCVHCKNRYTLKFEPKLKPCPHCGGKAIEKGTERVYIMCEDCGSSIKTYSTSEKVMEAWNRGV